MELEVLVKKNLRRYKVSEFLCQTEPRRKEDCHEYCVQQLSADKKLPKTFCE